MSMDNTDPKKLSVSLGGFSCQIEGYEDPMSVLREVTAHMRELSSSDAAFLAQADRRPVARPGQTIQVQPRAQINQGAPVQPGDKTLPLTQPPAEQGQNAASGPRNQTIQSLREMARGTGATAEPGPEAARQRTDAGVDLVEAPEGEAAALNEADRVDEAALTARVAELLKTKAVPEAQGFFDIVKADSPSELFEAGSAFLIHFQGYRHVTPKQVTRLLRRAQMVDEGGLANVDELVAELMRTGRIGGNMQEGLTLGRQSPYAPERLKA